MESIRPVFFFRGKNTCRNPKVSLSSFSLTWWVNLAIARLLVSLTTLREVGWAVATQRVFIFIPTGDKLINPIAGLQVKPYSCIGSGFKDFLFFTLIPGEMIPILTHIFQMGWFNHQLTSGWSRKERQVFDGGKPCWLSQWQTGLNCWDI